MSIGLNSLILRIATFVLLLVLAVFASSTILVSPSHPFVDNDGDGVDDFDEQSGDYADPQVRAKIYGVTFPIADLGSCANYDACRTFCEDPANATSCINYGKSRGFYQEESEDKIKEALGRAKNQLGCDSFESCHNFCEIPANYDRCHSLAKSVGVRGGYVGDPAKTEIVNKAKEVLGCNSAQSCQSYCEQEANRDKCSQFAQQVGLKGGEHQIGPGGCTSQATCQTFCSVPENYQICSGFTGASGGTFTGPGGCNSEASCQSYCQQNPQACGHVGGGPGASPPPGYNPQEMCNRTPNCSWAGNNCQCGFYGETKESAQKGGEYASYCQANPDKCRPGQSAGFTNPNARDEFERFCKEHPDKCSPSSSGTTTGTYGGSSGGTGDHATECARYGCSWTNNSCQCSGISGGTYTPPPPGSGGQYDPATECSKAPGCSWTGTTCQCSGGNYTPPPPSGTTPPPGYTPPASYTPPPGYTPPSSYTHPPPGYTPPASYTPPPGYTPPASYTPPPPPSSYNTQPPPPPSSYESSPPPPPPSGYEVHGISTSGGGLLEQILNWLRGR